mgnify:CR=1 FL=1
MIVSSRGSLIPTYSTGRVINSALSYVRFPLLREKERILFYFANGLSLRSWHNSGAANFSRSSFMGFRLNLYPNKRDMDSSQIKNFNFIDGVFRAAKIFSTLFARKSISIYNFQFSTKLISFVPKKIRSRKKNIFEGLAVRPAVFAGAEFFFFWRIYFYYSFLTRIKDCITDPGSVSSSRLILKVSDLSGFYFLGTDILNFENYSLSFETLISSTERDVHSSFPALSTPKVLRYDFSRKMHGFASRFRFLF